MNNGAFGENFPYSNFHDMNMDWLIQIAKDFLDQYTHIQEIITSGEEGITNATTAGVEQLQNKADALEELLQQWYNTHSEEIATELANAVESFTAEANDIGAHIIASLPPDYNTYSDIVQDIAKQHKSVNVFNRPEALNGNYGASGFTPSTSWKASPAYIEVGDYTEVTCHKLTGGAYVSCYNSNHSFISNVAFTDGEGNQTITLPANTEYIHVSMTNAAYNGEFTLALGNTATTNTDYYDNYRLNDKAFMKNVFIVDKNPLYGDFNTITDACANAPDNSIIFIRAGRYKEEIHLYGKTLTLIGEDPSTTVIYNYNHTRANPPLEISSGLIKNMGFESLNDGGSHPTTDRPYAVHIDDNSSAGKYLKFENCIFYAQWNSAVGIGMRRGLALSFDRCEFTTTSAQAAFFAHDSTNSNLAGNYVLKINNCTITSAGSASANFQGIGYTGNNFRILIRNSSFFDDTNGHTDNTIIYTDPPSIYPSSHGNKWLGSNTLTLIPLSFGNNVPLCNA